MYAPKNIEIAKYSLCQMNKNTALIHICQASAFVP